MCMLFAGPRSKSKIVNLLNVQNLINSYNILFIYLKLEINHKEHDSVVKIMELKFLSHSFSNNRESKEEIEYIFVLFLLR